MSGQSRRPQRPRGRRIVLKLCLAATCFILGALGSAVIAPGAHAIPAIPVETASR